MNQIRSIILEASGLIFDVDGTLIDSVGQHAEAWQKAFAAFGFAFELAAIRSQIGKGGDQLMPVFLSPEEIGRLGQSIETTRGDIFKRDSLGSLRGFAKVPELFGLLTGLGKKIALGSSAKADELQSYKVIAGIADFDTVDTTSDDAERSKPHPDIFAVACQRLGLRAAETVAIGDSPYDIEAARRAGLKAVGVLCGGFSEADLRGPGAVEIYRDPADLLRTLEDARRP